MLTWEQLRHRMVEEQLRNRGIRDERVLRAMETVPRHEFVPKPHRHLAYNDEPQPIGAEQTISQPYMVAAMAEALVLDGNEKVLEVGAGSGYAAAVMSLLAAHVYALDTEPALAELARANLEKTGFASQVTVLCGDGTLGYPQEAPYQAISVAAGAPRIPQALIDQLDPGGGRLAIPVGSTQDQELHLIRRNGDKTETRKVANCRFVPLRGAEGW
ncbi:MAG: protein-L-isoaspartate(D-aspartate) O-methyltransferase [Bryobacterales bacterium]